MEREISMSDDTESGYASGDSRNSKNRGEDLTVTFTRDHLKFLNQRLQELEPQDILRWCLTSLPHLYQTTALGLTGLAISDMLSKLDIPKSQRPDLIFLDTFYHFDETLHLLDEVRNRNPDISTHIFKPAGLANVKEFEEKFGEKLWETDDKLYDWLAKVEPARRAYSELNVNAVITGRRRSQGGKRGSLDILEVDENRMIKVNPLANWTFQEVQNYINKNNVPYNELLDRGYKSVGDWHSTQPVANGEDERAGRWKGQQKTECGIHNPNSVYARMLAEQAKAEIVGAEIVGAEIVGAAIKLEEKLILPESKNPLEMKEAANAAGNSWLKPWSSFAYLLPHGLF